MADVPFSEFGKGSIFRLSSRVTGQIASGVTGNILTLTAPAGQVARLIFLASDTATSQTGISVIRDGVTCLSGTLSDDDSSPVAGSFMVAETVANSSATSKTFGLVVVKTVAGSQIVINKNAGNTTQAINYAVEYGVIQ